MKKTKPFRKGQLVYHIGNAVLVTGPGNKEVGYPCFAGVVVMSLNRGEGIDWPVGMYSDTWDTDAFKKTGVSVSKIVKSALL